MQGVSLVQFLSVVLVVPLATRTRLPEAQTEPEIPYNGTRWGHATYIRVGWIEGKCYMSHSTGLCHLTSATAFTYETGVCHEEGLDSSCTQRVTNQEYDELSSASQKAEVWGVKSWLGTRGGREGGVNAQQTVLTSTSQNVQARVKVGMMNTVEKKRRVSRIVMTYLPVLEELEIVSARAVWIKATAKPIARRRNMFMFTMMLSRQSKEG